MNTRNAITIPLLAVFLSSCTYFQGPDQATYFPVDHPPKSSLVEAATRASANIKGDRHVEESVIYSEVFLPKLRGMDADSARDFLESDGFSCNGLKCVHGTLGSNTILDQAYRLSYAPRIFYTRLTVVHIKSEVITEPDDFVLVTADSTFSEEELY